MYVKVFRECGTNGNVKKAKSIYRQNRQQKKRKEQRKKIVKQEAVEVQLT